MIRRAVVDVGTNSVKLLIGDVAGTSVNPVFETSEQTRLGRGFYDTQLLQASAITATVEAIRGFVDQANAAGAHEISIVATSAARDASNAQDLLSAIEKSVGVSCRVLSGDEEAAWVFQGVLTQSAFWKIPVMIADVGGGSSECIVGHEGRQLFRRSYQMGTVRLLERQLPGDLPGNEARRKSLSEVKQFVRDHLGKDVGRIVAEHPSMILVGTGGTASILARVKAGLEVFDRARIEEVVMTLDDLRDLSERFWTTGLEERQAIIGVPSKRADVILTGSLIFEAMLEVLGIREMRVSTRGLRFAALLQDAELKLVLPSGPLS